MDPSHHSLPEGDDSTESSRDAAPIEERRGEAFSDLWSLLHDQLHELAGKLMQRQGRDHTLQATALMNEAYLRLAGNKDLFTDDRRKFFGLASRVMRSILVDHARAKNRVKRRPNGERLPLDGIAEAYDTKNLDVLALDDALVELKATDPQLLELVELRFFGGRSMQESAEILGVPLRSAERDWAVARAWLQRKLS